MHASTQKKGSSLKTNAKRLMPSIICNADVQVQNGVPSSRVIIMSSKASPFCSKYFVQIDDFCLNVANLGGVKYISIGFHKIKCTNIKIEKPPEKVVN
jgi:hypothetical protein